MRSWGRPSFLHFFSLFVNGTDRQWCPHRPFVLLVFSVCSSNSCELMQRSFEVLGFCCRGFDGLSANSVGMSVCRSDCLLTLVRPSVRGAADWLSPLLLELRFYFGSVSDLFLGLLGPSWLHDFGKIMWVPLLVTLGLSQFSLEECLSVPIHSPPGCLIGPSIGIRAGYGTLWV
jgi:hypothetical protein